MFMPPTSVFFGTIIKNIRIIACIILAVLLIGNAYYLGSEEVRIETSSQPYATYPPRHSNEKNIPPNIQLKPDPTLQPPSLFSSQEYIPPFLSASNDKNMFPTPKENNLPKIDMKPKEDISESSDLPASNQSNDIVQDSVPPAEYFLPQDPLPSPLPSTLPSPSSSHLLYSHCKGMENEGSAHCLLQNACFFNKTLYINATYNSSLFPPPDSFVVPQSRYVGNQYSLSYLPNHNITTSATSFIPGISILFF
eukprot:Phypoly_transcript_06699.p2 GENE.Phypoly_transcript_06699~~Phypoly_transcript_06699.p2  ORF type:complete len:251 (+),score=38.27 Phypoly_transcript_06699:32-784(+)